MNITVPQRWPYKQKSNVTVSVAHSLKNPLCSMALSAEYRQWSPQQKNKFSRGMKNNKLNRETLHMNSTCLLELHFYNDIKKCNVLPVSVDNSSLRLPVFAGALKTRFESTDRIWFDIPINSKLSNDYYIIFIITRQDMCYFVWFFFNPQALLANPIFSLSFKTLWFILLISAKKKKTPV